MSNGGGGFSFGQGGGGGCFIKGGGKAGGGGFAFPTFGQGSGGQSRGGGGFAFRGGGQGSGGQGRGSGGFAFPGFGQGRGSSDDWPMLAITLSNMHAYKCLYKCAHASLTPNQANECALCYVDCKIEVWVGNIKSSPVSHRKPNIIPWSSRSFWVERFSLN